MYTDFTVYTDFSLICWRSEIIDEHEAQLLNYLKATEIEVGYVFNFGKSATFKRKVFDNSKKGSLRWTRK